MKIDDIYKKDLGPFPFEFNSTVAEVFDDMLVRSIPGYEQTLRFLLDWSHKALTPKSKILDVGCSTGNSLFYLASRLNTEISCYKGIDPSQAMIEKALLKKEALGIKAPLYFEVNKAQEVNFQGFSLIIFNYTLQFISVQERLPILKRIYSEIPNGSFIFISEKIYFENDFLNKISSSIYHEFKSGNGYSQLEIAKKKSALENVLVPMSHRSLCELIQEAGFQSQPVLQFNNFVSILGIKI